MLHGFETIFTSPSDQGKVTCGHASECPAYDRSRCRATEPSLLEVLADRTQAKKAYERAVADVAKTAPCGPRKVHAIGQNMGPGLTPDFPGGDVWLKGQLPSST